MKTKKVKIIKIDRNKKIFKARKYKGWDGIFFDIVGEKNGNLSFIEIVNNIGNFIEKSAGELWFEVLNEDKNNEFEKEEMVMNLEMSESEDELFTKLNYVNDDGIINISSAFMDGKEYVLLFDGQ